MGHKFAEITFTETVKSVQERMGSRNAYAKREGDTDLNNALGETEAAFVKARDSFYMATVGETGWPYVQHRGGPAGFLRVLDEVTLGFADFSGNRQYVSVGNVMTDDRISLFLMDYPNKTRLKILGRVQLLDKDDAATLDKLAPSNYRARVERGMLIIVEAFDWNCPQHITPRYSQTEMEAVAKTLVEKIIELEEELTALREG